MERQDQDYAQGAGIQIQPHPVQESRALPRELSNTFGLVSDLERVVEELQNRLESVTMYTPRPGGDEKCGDVELQSPLVTDVSRLNIRLRALFDTLSDTIDAVQL